MATKLDFLLIEFKQGFDLRGSETVNPNLSKFKKLFHNFFLDLITWNNNYIYNNILRDFYRTPI